MYSKTLFPLGALGEGSRRFCELKVVGEVNTYSENTQTHSKVSRSCLVVLQCQNIDLCAG